MKFKGAIPGLTCFLSEEEEEQSCISDELVCICEEAHDISLELPSFTGNQYFDEAVKSLTAFQIFKGVTLKDTYLSTARRSITCIRQTRNTLEEGARGADGKASLITSLSAPAPAPLF